MSAINKVNESRIAKLFSTVHDIEERDLDHRHEIVLPSGMRSSELKLYVEKLIKEAQPRYIRNSGRPSHELKDYKIPFNYFVVESNTVPFMTGRGSFYYDDLDPHHETEEEEKKEREQEEEDILIDLEEGGVVQVSGMEIKGGVSVDEDIQNQELKVHKKVTKQQQTRERVDVIISNESTTARSNIPNPGAHSQLASRDYGEMIINHIFVNGRKTIDEMVKELPAIEKHLMTLLINKLIADGYLILKDDVDIIYDDETGEEKERIELKTLEIVPIKKQSKLVQKKENVV